MTKNDTIKKHNPLIFPLIAVGISGLMYMIAFHNVRNENDELKTKIEKLEAIDNECK